MPDEERCGVLVVAERPGHAVKRLQLKLTRTIAALLAAAAALAGAAGWRATPSRRRRGHR